MTSAHKVLNERVGHACVELPPLPACLEREHRSRRARRRRRRRHRRCGQLGPSRRRRNRRRRQQRWRRRRRARAAWRGRRVDGAGGPAEGRTGSQGGGGEDGSDEPRGPRHVLPKGPGVSVPGGENAGWRHAGKGSVAVEEYESKAHACTSVRERKREGGGGRQVSKTRGHGGGVNRMHAAATSRTRKLRESSALTLGRGERVRRRSPAAPPRGPPPTPRAGPPPRQLRRRHRLRRQRW